MSEALLRRQLAKAGAADQDAANSHRLLSTVVDESFENRVRVLRREQQSRRNIKDHLERRRKEELPAEFAQERAAGLKAAAEFHNGSKRLKAKRQKHRDEGKGKKSKKAKRKTAPKE